MRVSSVAGMALGGCIVCWVLLSIGGCGKSPYRPSSTAEGDGFQAVVDRIQAESEAGSVNGTKITILPVVDGPDGRRIVKAQRVRAESTTDYSLDFKPDHGGWVCCEAVALETGSGNERTDHRLSGPSIELDKLILWLGW